MKGNKIINKPLSQISSFVYLSICKKPPIFGENFTISPAKTTETIDINLIRMFSEGPDVSLNGSPTVSPTTAALCASDPFPPCCPVSINFFALSQAPPAFAMKIARRNPVDNPPTSKPILPGTPKIRPTIIGINIASKDGSIISFCAPFVLMDTHDA